MRMCGQPPEHVLEVVERRHVDQFAALDERVPQRRAAGAFKAAGKQPILALMLS
jgi:hypothetical protein